MNNVHLRSDTISRIIENPEQLILTEATALAQAEGLSKLNMRKIAANCGIALGTIYNYYPTKMDLIIAIIEDFWKQCFRGMHQCLDENLDFFQQLEVLYFYLLDYLEQFEKNWLEELSSLSVGNKIKGKEKEAEFMEHFLKFFRMYFASKKHVFNPEVLNAFGEEKVISFILTHFFTMLKNFDHDYAFFDCVLKKILK